MYIICIRVVYIYIYVYISMIRVDGMGWEVKAQDAVAVYLHHFTHYIRRRAMRSRRRSSLILWSLW